MCVIKLLTLGVERGESDNVSRKSSEKIQKFHFIYKIILQHHDGFQHNKSLKKKRNSKKQHLAHT